jgi:hypothetical protein
MPLAWGCEVTMSHVNHIGGSTDTGIIYQEHLARMKASREAEGQEKARRKNHILAFDSAIDPDRDREAHSEAESGAEEGGGSGDDGRSPPRYA